MTSIFEGYNATILAYGQTGSGKTFTMGTGGTDGGVDSDDPNVGIVPRVINEIFSQTESRKEATPGASFNVRVQFLELYGDDLRDLLCRNPVSGKPLAIREDEHGSMQVRHCILGPCLGHFVVFTDVCVGMFCTDCWRPRSGRNFSW